MNMKMIKGWQGSVTVNGVEYNSIYDIPSDFNSDANTVIVLNTKEKRSADEALASANKEYIITVRKYMTKNATPEFDFMAKWNNDIPMPLMTMQGTIEKETPGMYKMKLRGNITGKPIFNCMKCGKQITNPVSQYFGMGPECGGHNYVSPFNTEEELRQAISEYREKMQNITWDGWVIKSAITCMEEIKED